MRPPYETFKGATCKGCYALGTACGTCEKCVWDKAQIDRDMREIVNPIEQLAMSLRWEEEYTDEYKARVIADAIKYVTGK